MSNPKPRRGRGEGGVERLPSGSYRATVSLGTDPDTGKPLRVKGTFPRKTEALAWAAGQKALLARGELAAPSKVTLAEYAARWVALRRASGIKGGSVEFYRDIIDRHITPRIGGAKLAALTKAGVEDWLAQLVAAGVPADRRKKAVTTLRSILKAAAEDRLCAGNPAGKVKRPKHKAKEIRFWTAEEGRKVVKAAEGRRLGAFFVLALNSGCRVGELQALHWTEVDLDAGTIRVVRTLSEEGVPEPPKTPKARRTIRVGPATVAALRRHRAAMAAEGRDVEAGIVFPALKSGGYLDYDTLYRRYFGGLVKAAGVPWIGPHGMRHTSATLLLRAGEWVKAVSERLGHEDIETTLRIYAHCIPGDDARAAEVLDDLLSGKNDPRDRLTHDKPTAAGGRPFTSPEVQAD